MWRLSALTAAIMLAACARHTPPPSPAAAPVARSAIPAPPVPRPQTQSETEQATASQESTDGDTEQAKSDASLEQIAGSTGAQLPSGKWQAGVNYDPLVPAQPTSVAPGKVEVLEIFWLACAHCYTLEPYLQGWLRTKPAYIEFVRVPVNWQSIYAAHARLYYTLQELARPDLIAKAFATIHDELTNHQPPLYTNNADETFRLQQQFAVQNGVSADGFAGAYNSAAVAANVAQAEEITQRYHVKGVPLLVVNGRYTTDLDRAGGDARLIELINELAASEHGH
jgi:protein dithiol oxidoreductase (disulfide-forming)